MSGSNGCGNLLRVTGESWQTVEHWQARSELGVLELCLQRAGVGQAWRVVWCRPGERRGVTFAGTDPERRARAELERRKAKYVRVWQLLG